MYAVKVGNTPIVRCLIKAKANINIITKVDNMSALHLACLLEYVGIAVLLVRGGADTDLKDHVRVRVIYLYI